MRRDVIHGELLPGAKPETPLPRATGEQLGARPPGVLPQRLRQGENGRALGRPLTLGRRFGVYYLLLVALLSCVCIAVVIYLGRMRRDAARVLEETREHALATEILVKLQALDAMLARNDAPWELPPADLERAQGLLQEIRRAFERLDGRAGDPSRAQHQAREERLGLRVVTNLDRLSSILAGSDPRGPGNAGEEMDAILGDAQAFASSLDAETRREALRADGDLMAHGATTRQVMIATVVVLTLALCAGFVHVLRTVVAPLRVVRAGADRFGAGQF